MEKCPRCGRWTLELSTIERALKCYSMECHYERTVNVDQYLKEHNDLPLLVESLRLNGYHKPSQMRVTA